MNYGRIAYYFQSIQSLTRGPFNTIMNIICVKANMTVHTSHKSKNMSCYAPCVNRHRAIESVKCTNKRDVFCLNF